MTDRETCRGYGERADCDNEVPSHLLERGLCPKCDLLRKTDDEQRHRQTRDPTLEPY